jgi:hypothetical protein
MFSIAEFVLLVFSLALVIVYLIGTGKVQIGS